ncbi:hypothetical protein [Nostoc sp. ATCC 53789]|uniref:hypothetical protein n=1 Tax=Nostoc sp. ATCC 53789 TaxID=76335 RepID=UPI000DED04AA|nr:hypothetical protein [Nostoc sp. ATCC 53789]QHG14655.1 hypothetical protein GJB62_00685 [Nostoc sp. ATCC 53789]RCJ35866.1 hypothetical protein A6V25_00690 [Nostoc sp. ATCC 53789]
MVNRYLQDLDDVFYYVHPCIKNLDCGILHKVLYIILDNEPQNAEYICHIYGIKKSATKHDDQVIIDSLSLTSNPFRAMSNFLNPDKKELFLIVVIACLLVGSIGCIQFIQRRKNKERGGKTRNVQQPVAVSLQPLVPPLQSLTVALCLVVPAYVVNKLKDQYPIDANEIENLIDNTSYFLCTKVADAELVQQRLDLTNENILNVGERREVYVRIHIADGQEMLDKTVPYILKRNLPSHRQGVVKQLACLGDLSGLEAFNRV